MGPNRHRLGPAPVVYFDVIRSRPTQSAGIPGVLDPVVVLVDQEDAVFDAVSLVIAEHHAGQHIPFAEIDARGERPTAPQQISAGDLPGTASGANEGRGDKGIDV